MATDFSTSFISPERGMEDIYTDKQAVWDAVVEEYPMMAYSPIFKEGFDRWNAGGGITQSFRNILGRVLDVPFDVGATGWGRHINVNPPKAWATERDTHAVMGHEISHLGMKTGLDFAREEDLNRLHDRIYQPSSYMATQETQGIPYLMNQGYIEQTNIPGGLSYVGSQDGNYGTQHTNRGNEFIRESRLPQHQQRALGYVEPSRPTNQAPVRSTPTRDPNEGRHHFNTGGLASLML
tara:strand:- start:7 stop:717 length:711 start_codon:yes stop_codon:yes gene_type:complete